jgi:hypothetical protein
MKRFMPRKRSFLSLDALEMKCQRLAFCTLAWFAVATLAIDARAGIDITAVFPTSQGQPVNVLAMGLNPSPSGEALRFFVLL